MAYEYDVFISYRSKSKEWLQEVFLPGFVHYLEEEVGDGLKIFVDWHDIATGDAWEQRLKGGLLKSKCLVSLLIPSYFESEWCTKEFSVFENRSRHNGMLTLERPESLIIPVALHHGQRFPEPVHKMQILDYKDFYSANIEGYKKRKKYQRLLDELKILAQTVGKKIREEVPDWNPEWQDDGWLELPTQHLRIGNFTVQQPKI